MSDEDDLARQATNALSSMVDQYGSVNTTVGQLLAQFGYSALTNDAVDDVWMVAERCRTTGDPDPERVKTCS